ncbi:hypothetical protein [Streptomyces sp. NPDC046161]|uniref:hypothetical protein n=1 Tax=Streptomyces sp. NPDC046161 TaxID=3155132 RepID=UPI0033F33C26
MNLRTAMAAVSLPALVVTLTACTNEVKGPEKTTMNEQQALSRAEQIVQQAVAGMSPKPRLKQIGSKGAGACLADPSGTSVRDQVEVTYQLVDVPGSAGKQLVRQARDAWAALGYKFQTDGDWSDPFPDISMRTEPDDFWMSAGNGMVSKETGDGRAYITVTSPCYTKPTSSPSTSPQAMLPSSGELSSDEASQQHVLAHSSRIHDALRVEADASAGAPLQTVENDGATYVHHAWATEPLAGERAVRAMARGRAFLEDSGWRVRAGSGRLVAMHPTDQTVVQIATSPSGSLRVGVTGPAVPLLRADA